MYASPFSNNTLKSVTRAGDSIRYNVNVMNDIEAIAKSAHDKIIKSSLDFSHQKVTTNTARELYLLNSYETILALRATAKALSSEYRISPLGRDKTVRSVLESLFDSTPGSIVRSDFSSFYENIDVTSVITDVMRSTKTHPHVKNVLSGLQQHGIIKPNNVGIPRGLGLSAVLSEMRLKDFDEKIRCLSGTYRYFRFADDFIIFTIKDPVEVLGSVKEIASQDLQLSERKTDFYRIPALPESARNDPIEIDFLGYKFIISRGTKSRSSRKIRVTFSDSKIQKRKTRIILALKDFVKTGNKQLFMQRIQMLTSNMSIRRSGHSFGARSARVNTGIYYNYRACGTYECINNRPIAKPDNDIPELKELDGFLHSLLWRSGSSFSGLIQSKFTTDEKNTLRSYSFSMGYKNKITIRLTRKQAADARRIWRHA